MDVEINNVIYMELNSGPKIVNSTCGKTINVETIARDSTVIAVCNCMKGIKYMSMRCSFLAHIDTLLPPILLPEKQIKIQLLIFTLVQNVTLYSYA